MELQVGVTFSDEKTVAQSSTFGEVVIARSLLEKIAAPIAISLVKGKVIKIANDPDSTAEQVIYLRPVSVEPMHAVEELTRRIEDAGGKTAAINDERIKIPTNFLTEVVKYVDEVLFVLSKLGVAVVPVKKKPFKAQHRWNKAVSTVEFFVDDFGSKATIIWQKRNEMVIKKGAKMVREAPLNKDGSVGLNQRVGEKLREEQKGKFKDLVTTEDIILKSVNEVSLFLYFAGTNSWLVFKDKDGKSIDEYTVVK